MLDKNSGYTLVELMIVVAMVGIIITGVLVVGIGFCGNFWFSEDKVLREIQADHPDVVEILKTDRRIFARSVITVTEDGKSQDYCLNTSILMNYKFSECRK